MSRKRAKGSIPCPDPGTREAFEVPRTWRDEPDRARTWVERSLAWAGLLPPKESRRRGPRAT